MNLRLAEFRKKLSLSQEDVARIAGVSPKTEWNWEKGKSFPTLAQAVALSDAFNCTLDELAGRETPAGWTDEFQAELNRCYEACTADRKAGILQVARDGALASGEAAERCVDASEGLSA